MSSEKSKAYREYALIEGINLLVHSVEQVIEDKKNLVKIYPKWHETGMLSLGQQMEFIFGTATDKSTCRYMVNCINELNTYMMSKYPNCIDLIRKLTSDILESINIAIMANAHIWNITKIESILTAFRSTHVGKKLSFYKSPREEEEEDEKKKRRRHPI